MQVVRTSLAVLFVCIVGFACSVEEASGQTSPDEKQQAEDEASKDESISLGSLAEGSYADRQKATLEMWRRRTLSRQAVQDAARNPDPEVSERAAWILRQWRSGAVPGIGAKPKEIALPPQPLQAIPNTTSNATAIARVMEEGRFDAALIAVEESAGTIEYKQIRSRIERLLIERFPIYIDQALRSGSEPSLLQLIETVASDRRLGQSAFDLRKQLDLPVSEPQGLPQSSSQWSELERQTMLTQLAMLRGDTTEALALAKKSGDQDVQRLTRLTSGRWDLMARDALEEIESWESSADEPLPAGPLTNEQIETLGWALVALERTGDTERADQIAQRLADFKAIPAGQTAIPVTNDFRWRVLAVHGRVDEAIDLLAKTDIAAATRIATTSSRFEKAFEIVGYPQHQIDTHLDQWIIDAYRSQASLQINTMAPEIGRLYALARLLVYCGDTSNAYRIYDELDSPTMIVDQNGYSMKDRTLFEVSRLNRVDWLIELAVDESQKRAGQNTYWVVSRAFEGGFESFRRLLDRIKVVMPGSSFHEQFTATGKLLYGEIPEGIDPERDFDRLYQVLARNPKVDRRGGRLEQFNQVLLTTGLIEMFQRHGQTALARKGLLLLASEGNVDAMLQLAESELQNGGAPQTPSLWDRVLDKSSEFSAANSIITVDHGESYAKAIVGKWIAARRAGHREAAEQLERRLRLMLASPSLKLRNGVARYLNQLDQHEFAAEVFRDLVVLASFAEEDSPDFYDVATAYANVINDLSESAPGALMRLGIDQSESCRWSDLVVLGILTHDNIFDTFFIGLPISVCKGCLEDAIRRGDREMAVRLIRNIESLDCLNIDFAERLIPDLKKAQWDDLADASLERLFRFGEAHIEQHGLDSTTLNNLAWTAAMNQRRLDDALEWSTRAVSLEPDSVVYRDTLAEVLHLRGETAQALAIESACLLDEPDEWHLHEQIEKYKALLSEAKDTKESKH